MAVGAMAAAVPPEAMDFTGTTDSTATFMDAASSWSALGGVRGGATRRITTRPITTPRRPWQSRRQVGVGPAPVMVGDQPPQSYWYYCPSAKGYYPTVPTCPEVWIKVPPRTQ